MAEVLSISTTTEIRKWIVDKAVSPSRLFVAGYLWEKERKEEFNQLKEQCEKLQKVVNRLQMELLEQSDKFQQVRK